LAKTICLHKGCDLKSHEFLLIKGDKRRKTDSRL